jgi:cell division initiation protein
MLTPQEVSTHAFTKAVMGGYNMAMVDEFLDELTDDYTALYKENAALKAKMKVLVEKVEEYRATEDSMRATLLTAQRMADSIVKEAEEKRDQILAQAESGAKERAAASERELAASQSRLRQGQQDLAQFIAASRELCDRQLKFLDQLPQLPVDASAPAEEHPVEEIEEKVMASFDQQPAEEREAEEEPKAAAAEYPEGDPFAPKPDLDATRRVNLDDLKFGRNYNSEN